MRGRSLFKVGVANKYLAGEGRFVESTRRGCRAHLVRQTRELLQSKLPINEYYFSKFSPRGESNGVRGEKLLTFAESTRRCDLWTRGERSPRARVMRETLNA